MTDTATTEPDTVEPTTPPPTNVIQALACVLAEMGGIPKLTPQERQKLGMSGGGGDDYGIKYGYRSIDQIAAAAQPLLGKFGIVMAPRVLSHDVTKVPVGQHGAMWDHHTMLVEYVVYGPGGTKDKIKVTVIGEGRDNSDKGANKAQTMAFKNALLRLLCIGDPADDPDHGKFITTEQPPVAGWWGGWVDQAEHEGVKNRILAAVKGLPTDMLADIARKKAEIAPEMADGPGGVRAPGAWPLTVDEAEEFERVVHEIISQAEIAAAETGESLYAEPTPDDPADADGGAPEVDEAAAAIAEHGQSGYVAPDEQDQVDAAVAADQNERAAVGSRARGGKK